MGKKGNKKKVTTKSNQKISTAQEVEASTEIVDILDKTERIEEAIEPVIETMDSKKDHTATITSESDVTKKISVSDDQVSTVSSDKVPNEIELWREKEADYQREKELLSLTVCNLQEQLATSILDGKNVQDRLEHAQATMMLTIQRIATLENNFKSLQKENDSLLQENETIQNSSHEQVSKLNKQILDLEAKVDSLTCELNILRPSARNTHILRDPSDQENVGIDFPPGYLLVQEYDNVCRLWKGFFDNLLSDDLSKPNLGDAWLEPAYITFLVGGVWDAAVARVDRFFHYHEELLEYNFGVMELADWHSCLPCSNVKTTSATNSQQSLMNYFMITSMQRSGLSKLLQEVGDEVKVEKLSSTGDVDAAKAAETKVVMSVGNAHLLWLHQIFQCQQRGQKEEVVEENTFTVLDLYVILVRFLAMCRMSDPMAYLGPRPSSLLTTSGDASDHRFISANSEIIHTQEQANNLTKATLKKTVFVNHVKKVDDVTAVEVRVLLPGMYFTYPQQVDNGLSQMVSDKLVSPSYSFVLQRQEEIDRLHKFIDEEAKFQLKRLEEELQGYVYPSSDNTNDTLTPLHDINSKEEEAAEDTIVDLHSVNVYASIPEIFDEESLEKESEDTTESEDQKQVTASNSIGHNDEEEKKDKEIKPNSDISKNNMNEREVVENLVSSSRDDMVNEMRSSVTEETDESPRKHIELGIIIQLLPEMHPFAPQQYVKASIAPMKLSHMTMTQLAQSLLRGLSERDVCHPPSTRNKKLHAIHDFVQMPFVFSTVDVMAIPASATTATVCTDTNDISTFPTESTDLLYRKMLRLKRSVYYDGKTVTIPSETNFEEDVVSANHLTVGQFLSEDIPQTDGEVSTEGLNGKKMKNPIIVITQVSSLPTASKEDDLDKSSHGLDSLSFIDLSCVAYDHYASALSFPYRITLSSANGTSNSVSPMNQHVSNSTTPSGNKAGFFKQLSRSFTFSARNLHNMDMNDSQNQNDNSKVNHFSEVLKRLSNDLISSVSISSTQQTKKLGSSLFTLVPKMLTLDYFCDNEHDPTALHRVVARVYPQYHWPQDEKDRFHKALQQMIMIYDVSAGEYLSAENLLRKHNYSLVVSLK